MQVKHGQFYVRVLLDGVEESFLSLLQDFADLVEVECDGVSDHVTVGGDYFSVLLKLMHHCVCHGGHLKERRWEEGGGEGEKERR